MSPCDAAGQVADRGARTLAGSQEATISLSHANLHFSRAGERDRNTPTWFAFVTRRPSLDVVDPRVTECRIESRRWRDLFASYQRAFPRERARLSNGERRMSSVGNGRSRRWCTHQRTAPSSTLTLINLAHAICVTPREEARTAISDCCGPCR